MKSPRLKGVRTDVGIPGRLAAGFRAVVGEVRKFMATNQPEVVLDDVLASSGVGTEPLGVSGRGGRDTLKVRVGVAGIGLGVRNGGADLRLLVRRAVVIGSPLAAETRDGKGTREPNLSNILNGGIEVLEGAISIDIGEQVRWLDGVTSRTRQSEVVRSGDW